MKVYIIFNSYNGNTPEFIEVYATEAAALRALYSLQEAAHELETYWIQEVTPRN